MNCSPSDYTLFISNINNSLDYYEDYCISKKKIIYNDKERFKDFITFLKNKVIYTKKKSEDIYDINFSDFDKCPNCGGAHMLFRIGADYD